MKIPSSQELFDAVVKNDINKVKLLIENGADVNVKDKDDLTPLHYASMNGYINIIKLLIKNSADIDAQGGNMYIQREGEEPELIGPMKFTPLHYAVKHKHYDVAELLIKKGADVKIRNAYKQRAINCVDDFERITYEFSIMLDIGYSEYCKYMENRPSTMEDIKLLIASLPTTNEHVMSNTYANENGFIPDVD